jgi:predicted RNA-binding protein with TRAM domain
VISEQTAAIDLERRLRALAHGSRVQAYRIEVNAGVATRLVGPGAARLQAIEATAKRRFFLEPKEDVHLDHFLVLQQGKLETLAPEAPFAEGATIDLQPVEVGLHDPRSAVAKLDGYDIVLADGAKLVGKKVKVQIERVLPGTAYATVVKKTKDGAAPITAEGEAEKPTRRPAAKKPTAETVADEKVAEKAVGRTPQKPAAKTTAKTAEATASGETGEDETGEAPPKKKTRRGSRGGRRHKKTPTIHVPEAGANGAEPEAQSEPAAQPEPLAEPEAVAEPANGADASGEAAADTDNGEAPKKKTRRGSRGGRNRRKKATAATPSESGDSG